MTTAADISPREIAQQLADCITSLAPYLLPGGHREGHEWRCGSIRGERGQSLGVHLSGSKAGVWCDFAAGIRGDALGLVCAVLRLDMGAALRWSRDWLGIERHEAQRAVKIAPIAPEAKADPYRWRYAWQPAKPIAGTLAARYLAARGLSYEDPNGEVLRFAERRARLSPAGDLEYHPALLALLRDVVTGEPCGLINIYLDEDGSDRLRDSKGKTVTGRARGAAVMLSEFDEPTYGLAICEGTETGIAILATGFAPVWCCGGAGTLATFPVLNGIEALTIAADADPPGQKAATDCATRWHQAGREARIVAPPAGDWADNAQKDRAA